MPRPDLSSAKTIRVLLLEDNALDAELNLRQLRDAGFEPQWQRVETEADYRAALDTATPDLIISDYSLPHFDGVRAAELIRERGLDIPFILVSGTLGEQSAVAAMKSGATDYLMKGNTLRLGHAVERALREKTLRDERKLTEKMLETKERISGAIVAAALDCIITMDHEGCVTEFNPASEQILGYPRAAVLGRKLEELIVPPQYRERHRQGLARYLVTRHSSFIGRRHELSALRADGTEFPVELTVVSHEDTNPPTFTAFLRDITDQKRAEQVTKMRNEELAKFNRMSVGRELRMIELKQHANELARRLGEPPPYPLTFLPKDLNSKNTDVLEHDDTTDAA